jgi:hypothetical protein
MLHLLMSSTKVYLRQIHAAIEAIGGKVVIVTQGRHRKIKYEYEGQIHTQVVSVSPSDGNSLARVKSDLRKRHNLQ